MSKAFTDEEALTAAVPGRAVVRAAPGTERPISRAGWTALAARAQTARERVAGTVGDERTRREYELALAEATLASVRVVEVTAPPGEVCFGCQVLLEWEDGREQRVVLVGPDELELDVRPGVTRVSVLSPLGRALVGQREGDEVELERPRGVASARIGPVSQSG